jgi:putative transposase
MEERNLKYDTRNSRMDLSSVYFWTDTIKNWKSLFSKDSLKQIIIDCLHNLVVRKKILVYGFVIMPNHIHLIWEMLELNGKEMPHASFNKFTSHQFLELLRKEKSKELNQYNENDLERKHRFWQRDPLAIHLDGKTKAEQKLEYIHLNPLQEKWNLVIKPEDYKWSSAKFYETGEDEFGILTDYRERF